MRPRASVSGPSAGRAGAISGPRLLEGRQWRILFKGWRRIDAGQIPVVMLVRDGAVVPRIPVAQSTAQMDWSNIRTRLRPSAKADGRLLVRWCPGPAWAPVTDPEPAASR